MSERVAMSTEERHLTTADLAARLQVPESTVRRWRSEGRGPAVVWVSPRRARYRLADVEAWEAAQRREVEGPGR
jgi:hypothetical protein